jgi:hypothetical protein
LVRSRRRYLFENLVTGELEVEVPDISLFQDEDEDSSRLTQGKRRGREI